MSSSFIPSISDDVFALRPDYCALSIVARGIDNTARPQAGREALGGSGDEPVTVAADLAEAHIESWRSAYRAFGAKPQRTPCSAEALRRRLESGGLPAINAVVDTYNAISARYALPVGGENIAAYEGLPRLIRADGTESFDTVKEGSAYTERVPAGEVIWRDDRGATCRRWNWRQGIRTRIEESTRDMWFVLERLEPLPIPVLLDAGRALIRALSRSTREPSVAGILVDRTGSSAL